MFLHVLTDLLVDCAEVVAFLVTAWLVAAGVDRCLRRNGAVEPLPDLTVDAQPGDGAYVDSDGVLTPLVPRQRDRRPIMTP